MMKLKNYVLMVCIPCILLTACSTSQEKLLPAGNQTMSEIWRKTGGNHTQSARLLEARDDLQGRSIDEEINENISYTRTAANEATNLFPRLPNPDLVMYVFPHLTNTEEPVPVPGYTTVFPFYGNIKYAQPGERTRRY